MSPAGPAHLYFICAYLVPLEGLVHSLRLFLLAYDVRFLDIDVRCYIKGCTEIFHNKSKSDDEDISAIKYSFTQLSQKRGLDLAVSEKHSTSIQYGTHMVCLTYHIIYFNSVKKCFLLQ